MLGHASALGNGKIVNFLLSEPDIDVSLGRKEAIFGVKGEESPLDMALQSNSVQVIHALVARNAPLKSTRREILDRFLRQHPVDTSPAEWIPPPVHQRLLEGTLQHMSDEEIMQGLHNGTLPCGWSSNSTWGSIQRQIQGQTQRLEQLKQQRAALGKKRRQLDRELAQIKQQTKELDSRLQVEERTSALDLAAFSKFAARVIPIEREQVEKLEAELRKKKPQVASMDSWPGLPKLSLMLNCMGIDASGIAATSVLDLSEFTRKSKKHSYFTQVYGSTLHKNTLRDLLYCGDMIRDFPFPFVGHEDECVVCACHTAKELINLIHEHGIELNEEVLEKEKINGRRVLYCTRKDFPDDPAEDVDDAIDSLLSLHEAHINP